MQHPLEFIPAAYAKRLFFLFLFLTLLLFGIFRVLDQPLRTDAAPAGIVSFELAGTPEQSALIVGSWHPCESGLPDDTLVCDSSRLMLAAFGLGIDYLFMPLYSFALAFGTLLTARKHADWLKSLGVVAGCGAFAAWLFDAAENFALFQVLLGEVLSPYPAIAAFCATTKFALLAAGIGYALLAGLLPKKRRPSQ